MVLFEAATGQNPFYTGGGTDSSADGARYKQLERRAAPIRMCRRVPPLFASAVDGCLEPDVSLRPTVKELTALLSELV